MMAAGDHPTTLVCGSTLQFVTATRNPPSSPLVFATQILAPPESASERRFFYANLGTQRAAELPACFSPMAATYSRTKKAMAKALVAWRLVGRGFVARHRLRSGAKNKSKNPSDAR